jgi:formylglycine-generating enzyme required for sulfatase activity
LIALLIAVGCAWARGEQITVELSDTESMTLVKVPTGTFMMGSPTTEMRRVRDGRECPQREVTIFKDFHIGICEVTRGQFAAFVKDSGYVSQAERDGWCFAWNGRIWTKVQGASWRNVGFNQTDTHPVVCICFNDAVEFCRWTSKKSGRPVRLPTEAQWEYAARAGTSTAYTWGDSRDAGGGWMNGCDLTAKKTFRGWKVFSWDDGYLYTSPVGTFKANAFGLHDVHGNAWEWCADWYDPDYYKNGPTVDPTGPENGSMRVLRGGGWMSTPSRCRVSGRSGCPLRGSFCDFIVGFRIVIDNTRKLPTREELEAFASLPKPKPRPHTRNTNAEKLAAVKPPDTETFILTLGKGVTMKLVRIPAGKFVMGSPQDVKGRSAEEGPQREVTITKPFYMGVTEMTQRQFKALYGPRFRFDKPFRFRGPDNPIETISWNNLVMICRELSKKTKRIVRLPTEAEWEYACRAGTRTPYGFGDSETGLDHGWFKANTGFGTHPVAQKLPNAFGLYDMHGNVWEACSDKYAESYANMATIDPKGPAESDFRVLRGGSWRYESQYCRSTSRYLVPTNAPCYEWGGFGLRVVVEVEETPKLSAQSLARRSGWCDWRGPGRDGISPHLPGRLDAKPRVAWTQKTTGPGLSGLAVMNGRVIVADKSADKSSDIWRCLDAVTGKELWQLKYSAKGKMPYTNSPRATPVICDGRAYLLGAFGDLHCVAFDSGEILWRKQLIKRFGAELPTWGMTSTPLLIDDKLIVNPGAPEASLIALDRISGEMIWKTPGLSAAYGSFIYAEFNAQRQAVGYDKKSMGGWDIDSGRRLWRVIPRRKHDYNVPTPIVVGRRLLAASENNSTRLYDTGGTPKMEHEFDDLAPNMITPVVYNQMVFGVHDEYLYCLDAHSLKLLWKARDEAYEDYASLLAGNGHVMITTVRGELLLVRADREKHELISRMQVFTGDDVEVWSHPAISDGCLYIRDKAAVACLLLK